MVDGGRKSGEPTRLTADGFVLHVGPDATLGTTVGGGMSTEPVVPPDENWWSREAVLTQFCQIGKVVQDHLGYAHAADCFCGGNPLSTDERGGPFRYAEAVLQFVDRAVREVIERARPALPAPERISNDVTRSDDDGARASNVLGEAPERADTPSVAGDRAEPEKERRVHYQDIVYGVLARLETLTGERNTQATRAATLGLLERAVGAALPAEPAPPDPVVKALSEMRRMANALEESMESRSAGIRSPDDTVKINVARAYRRAAELVEQALGARTSLAGRGPSDELCPKCGGETRRNSYGTHCTRCKWEHLIGAPLQPDGSYRHET